MFRSYDHHQVEKYIATLGLLNWQRTTNCHYEHKHRAATTQSYRVPTPAALSALRTNSFGQNSRQTEPDDDFSCSSHVPPEGTAIVNMSSYRSAFRSAWVWNSVCVWAHGLPAQEEAKSSCAIVRTLENAHKMSTENYLIDLDKEGKIVLKQILDRRMLGREGDWSGSQQRPMATCCEQGKEFLGSLKACICLHRTWLKKQPALTHIIHQGECFPSTQL
jgi:hypothetical protein